MRLGLVLILTGSALGQTFDCITPGPNGTCALLGPAELPRSQPLTVAVSPGPTISVPATGDLQAAVNSATCGAIIQWDPAGDLHTALFSEPMIATCDAAHWITIDLNHGKITITSSSGHIQGGIFTDLKNGEITRQSGIGIVYDLIDPGVGAHDVIYDSLYVHGNATEETVRGLETSNVPNGVVINSRFDNFHCLSISGSCTDSQAINGGLSTQVADCNWLIQNNSLSAAGENILLGGGAANFVPCDWTITGNTFYKPSSWNPSDPSYAPVIGKDGLPHSWVVKNLFELKNANRVLAENNTMTGSWGGFTQIGFGVLFTPKNPGGCSVCAVTNITFRKNDVSHTGSAMQLAFGKSDTGFYAADAGNWSIHDNFFGGQQYTPCFACVSYLNQLSTVISPTGVVLHDVSVMNNEFIPDGQWARHYQVSLIVGAPTGSPMQRIHWDSNLFPQGNLTMLGVGGVGAADCGYQLSKPSDFLTHCFDTNSTMTGNGILIRGWTPAAWPAGNLLLGSGANIN